MAYDYVSIEREDRVATVTFDRGNRLNPLSLKAIEELTDAALNFRDDLETSAIVLRTPDGSGFSAGRDLADPAMELRRDKPMLARRHAAGAGKRLCAAWEGLEQFTIAAIEWFAIGGGLALAAAFDLRVMGRSAHFRAPEVALGLSMSWGTIPRLVALVGPARAKQILCLGNDRIEAADALAWGLAQEVVEDGQAATRALELAARAAAHDQDHRQRHRRRARRSRHPYGHRRSHADRADRGFRRGRRGLPRIAPGEFPGGLSRVSR